MEMAKFKDDPLTSQSTEGKYFPDFEMLDARIASALKRNISNTSFRRRVSVEEQRAQKHNRFLRRRQIAYMIRGHIQVPGAVDAAQGGSDLFNICLQHDDVHDFDARWDQILLGTSEMPPESVLEGFVEKKVARFRTTSNGICSVQPRIESRSRDTGLSKRKENGKTTC